jgi:hypothetical protein
LGESSRPGVVPWGFESVKQAKYDAGEPPTSWLFRILLVTLCLCSCAHSPPQKVYLTPTALGAELNGDVRTLRTLRPHLDRLDGEFAELREQGQWVKRGYFSPAENDRMEGLLFRFVTAHSALWEITAAYQNMQNPFNDPVLDANAYVLSSQASLLLASHSAFVVAEFADDPIAIAEMNEAFYRMEIPRDRYYELARSITPERLFRLRRAGALARAELANPDSELAHLAAGDAGYAELVELNRALQTKAEARMKAALAVKATTDPEPIHETDESVENGLYIARSVLFKNVSRLKSPMARLIRFSDGQKARVHELLRPGDLILTYTAGYTSDVFIPGAFKHGITYVGSPAQREQAGLRPDAVPAWAPDARNRLPAHIAQTSLADGKPADIIESVAEGVIFNNLTHIMDTHINRMLVLRPQLTPDERRDFLIETFSYLGEEYDFRFDFADSTRQVCTEVIYRAIQGKAGIDFHLTMRAGHVTLSADDIVLYFLHKSPQAFQLVLYAEEDPDGQDHAALILNGEASIERLKTLMKSVGE